MISHTFVIVISYNQNNMDYVDGIKQSCSWSLKSADQLFKQISQ